MEKIELQKSRLDKGFDFKSKLAMGWFTFGTVTFLGFIAAMVLQEQYWSAGVIGTFILIISFLKYRKVKKDMIRILNRLEQLK